MKISGSRFWIWGLGFGVKGMGFEFQILQIPCTEPGQGFCRGIRGLDSGLPGLGFRVSKAKALGLGIGFKV